MGAGGAAPPVRSEDVMILVGSTILLTIFVIQAWSIPTNIECSKDEDGKDECETFRKYELRKETFSHWKLLKVRLDRL